MANKHWTLHNQLNEKQEYTKISYCIYLSWQKWLDLKNLIAGVSINLTSWNWCRAYLVLSHTQIAFQVIQSVHWSSTSKWGIYLLPYAKESQEQWHRPAVPVTWVGEAGGWFKPRNLGPAWVTWQECLLFKRKSRETQEMSYLLCGSWTRLNTILFTLERIVQYASYY